MVSGIPSIVVATYTMQLLDKTIKNINIISDLFLEQTVLLINDNFGFIFKK